MDQNSKHDHDEDICSAEHMALYRVLKKMLDLDKMQKFEMEEVLKKSGLSKIKEGQYKNRTGAILIFDPK